MSFKLEQSPNTQLLELAGRLTELELAVATHHVSSDRYKELEKDFRDSKNMYLEAIKDIRLELQEKDKDLKEREEEIELLCANITTLAQFQKKCEDGAFVWDPGSSEDEDEDKGGKDAARPKPSAETTGNASTMPTPTKSPAPKKSRNAPQRRFCLPRVSLDKGVMEEANNSTSKEEF
jgi:hypothetical protein